jgi:hypothetical protein
VRAITAIAWVALAWLMLASTGPRALAGPLEPVLASYDAIPGQPLVLAVRVEPGQRPGPRVTLRFPDGQEVQGEVAAVKLEPPADPRGGWLAEGARWRVLGPAEALADRDAVAWFVLVDLPEGVIGQELWLDGQPLALRWLPRPALLAARMAFPAEPSDAGPLADPWSSPLPEVWRSRPDLAEMLRPARADPLRRWRAALAATGLHPRLENGPLAITPDLLDSGLVEASSVTAPLAERLVDAVASLTEAKWRIGLARLWAAEAALSLRVRHALAGAGSFTEAGSGEAVIAPVWPADARRADALLDSLLDDRLAPAERAKRAEEWLAGLPDLALWVRDDGVGSRGPVLSAMYLPAGDATAVELGPSEQVPRPHLLQTRQEATIRAFTPAQRGEFIARVAGKDRQVALSGGAVPVTPPGLPVGPFLSDEQMDTWLGLRPIVAGNAALASGLLAARVEPDGRARWTLFLRTDGDADRGVESFRVWLGPRGMGRGVVTVSSDGGLDLHRFRGSGDTLGEPTLLGLSGDRSGRTLEVVLPEGSLEPDGTMHIGIECVYATGERGAWPRPMLPWQLEPARRVIDTRAWLGGLTP